MAADQYPPDGGQTEQPAPAQAPTSSDTTSAPVQMLEAYSQQRASMHDVMRALTSHRGWLVPALLVAHSSAEQSYVVDNMVLFGMETRLPPGELWIFTDRAAAGLAQAAGALLGAYAGGITGTELFRRIEPNVPTVRVNPYSPRARTWVFQEGSAAEVGPIWADAIAFEESFAQWQQTGQPDQMAVSNYRAYLLFNHSSGPVITLPNQAGMANPAAVFTAPDCADTFLAKLSDEQRAAMQQVVSDGAALVKHAAQLGIDGLLINAFGPGATYAFPFN